MENKNAAKSSWAVAFTVASVWFGTHVGGGFATGNQVIQYFVQYGWTAAIYPLIAMGILAYVMYVVMKFARLNGFDNYKDTWRALYPKPWMEIFFEIFYIVILLAAVAAAVAGAGAVLQSYIGLPLTICNLFIVALLIVLSIFGVKLVVAASTVLSTCILIVTAILVITGLTVNIDGVVTALQSANEGLVVQTFDEVVNHNPLKAAWMGILVYAAFQCVSIPAMIAASPELSIKGVKRSAILGWLMNGVALAASAYMLCRWYPVLCGLKEFGTAKVAELTAANMDVPVAIKNMANALGIPNQTVITSMGSAFSWLLVVYNILLFCAFVSTSVTLIFSMIQRFQGVCFPKTIKSEKVRSIIVGALAIGICFALSTLGLSGIIKYAYGYDGYYAIVVIIIPVLIWGIPKTRKLAAEKKAE